MPCPANDLGAVLPTGCRRIQAPVARNGGDGKCILLVCAGMACRGPDQQERHRDINYAARI
jgi:hypothetical protein